MPTAGRGRRHLSLGGPATAVALGPNGMSGGEATAPKQGSGVGAGRSPPPPSPATSVGAAALPEERPSRALCPAAPASGARCLSPSPLAPSARSSAAEPPLPPQGAGADPREPGPPSAYSPSLRAAGSALLSCRRRSRGSLGGRTGRWDWTGSRAGGGLAPGGGRAAPREQAGTNGPRGAGAGGLGGPRREARLQAAVRGGESAAAS